MDLQLNGKVALVTAASRGLGRAVALRLAQEGAETVICARSSDALFRTAAEIRSATQRECLAIQADVTRDSDIRALVRQTLANMGRIDILVTNAGGPPPGGFLDVPLDAWASARLTPGFSRPTGITGKGYSSEAHFSGVLDFPRARTIVLR